MRGSDTVGRRVKREDAGPAGELVGESEPMRSLRRAIADVAPLESTVLLTGETGVGKGLAARVLHRMSRRRRGPFVHADCASLAPSVIESELFGHERGAFTGAVARRAGRFERAARGTLFLDEVGELIPRLQATLLRVLQDREYERVGGVEPLPMTARVVAATSRELREDVRAGRFRADLYFRLNVVHLHVPPLRSRRRDVRALARAGLSQVERRLGLPPPVLAEDALARLSRCEWHGNVRELWNTLERLAIRHPGHVVSAVDLEPILDEALWARDPSPRGVVPGPTPPAEPPRERIASALEGTGGNVARAARLLGLPRSTLRRHILRLGLRSGASAHPQHGEAVPEDEPQGDDREHPHVEPGEPGLGDAAQDPTSDPRTQQYGETQQGQGQGEGREGEAGDPEDRDLGDVAEGLAGGLGADDRLAREAQVAPTVRLSTPTAPPSAMNRRLRSARSGWVPSNSRPGAQVATSTKNPIPARATAGANDRSTRRPTKPMGSSSNA
jgi:DNA-binding NtrC family response regulator